MKRFSMFVLIALMLVIAVIPNCKKVDSNVDGTAGIQDSAKTAESTAPAVVDEKGKK